MIELEDRYGRRIQKLRISLLDACNLRCTYCMPEHMSFMGRERFLQPHQIYEMAKTLVAYGLREIRVTGGEPTLRQEFIEIMRLLSDLPLRSLGLTTNGVTLDKHLDELQHTALRSINVSLDSLSPDKFFQVTRRKVFERVYDNILKAQDMGFHVKVNSILMKGINDDEIDDFVDFSARYGIEVRFLELMKIGQANGTDQRNRFMAADDAIDILLKNHELKTVPVAKDSTSFVYQLNNGAKIGFIASETKPFCGNCSRWRLTADGHLRACLMSEKGVNLRNVPVEQYDELLGRLLTMKPTGRIEKIDQDMYQIGG
ncbi:GTP 3',8-cyclase MoaA [Pseudobacteriovorax antillogorgiicola]|uniref:GTP 3',8-cyclase n=1 Tax=Pseudobacteriovorax antillogorgiicola TaxID=1513793 RepID=A0A1Y6C9H4_9BACT|nr:GTP 3',8-cyclase MoaA [Pseudobacteriovorax antillogorgiicola]TCS49015.1 cyclic pyranopterin monophosphate synthase subunit MoaA [Pseudobacteriovorax antillogorgiicola]SMF53021.1 cyclic pyranopterin monophosphate synthase subunit MoaA [Pseudobacteriovorax antillogorgiicola]